MPAPIEELIFGIDDVPKEIDKRASKSSKRRKNEDKKSQGLVKSILENSDSDPDPDQASVNDEDCIVSPAGGSAKRKRIRADPSTSIPAKVTLICGFDFGMTNSGLAFGVDTKLPESVTCQKAYPGCSEHRSKVPTIIAYQHENRDHDTFSDNESLHNIENVFGFEVEIGMKRHAFFKTALDKGTSPTEFDDPSLNSEAAEVLLKRSRNRIALQAVEDCLLHLRKIFIRNLSLESGDACDNILDKFTLKTVLTHPAAMSLEGRANLRAAAISSGWMDSAGSTMVLRSEAEAAAISAFITHKNAFGPGAWVEAFKKRTGIAVVDIGGYTTDATTFQVLQNAPRLKLTQVCVPAGGRCGTVLLYCRLHEHLAELFGKPFRCLPEDLTGHGSPLLTEFERELTLKFDGKNLHRKRRFSLKMDDDFRHERYDSIYRSVILTGYEIKGMMDQTLHYITSILDNQIHAAEKHEHGKVETVILCGGGATFPYYHEQIRAFCLNHASGTKRFLTTADPLSCVSVGAMISELQQRIVGNRKVEACYGVQVHRKLEAGDQDQDDTFECPYGGKRKGGFVDWHVLKGDDIDLSKPHTIKTTQGYIMLDLFHLHENTQKSIAIYSYNGDDMPPPDRIDDPRVVEIGHLIITPSSMSGIGWKKLMRARKTAIEESNVVKLNIVQIVNAQSGLLEFEAKVNKRTIGQYSLKPNATTAA